MTPEKWAEIARVKMGLAPNLKSRWAACAEVIRAAEAAAYADGWRAGAEAVMGTVLNLLANWGYENTVSHLLRALPLPEPPAKGE